MSGITPVLGRIAQIESRFAPGTAALPRAFGVAQTQRSSVDVSSSGIVDRTGTSEFDAVMAAAESTLDPSVLERNDGLPPGLEFISPTGRTPQTSTNTPSAAPIVAQVPVTTTTAPTTTVPITPITPITPAVPTGATARATNSAEVVPAGTPFADLFTSAARANDVPAGLLAAVGWVESRYDVGALSPDGAIGVMQLMPGTAAHLGVDPHDPADAIDGAARLLRSHHDQFGSWETALAAYFSGAGAVARNGNQAPPRGAEYAQRVLDRMDNA